MVRQARRSGRIGALKYFLDAEFNGFCGPLISLGLVREDDASVYYVFDPPAEPEPWTAEHVLPILWDCPFPPRIWTHSEAAEDLGAFMHGDDAPVVIADWPEDIGHFCDLIIIGPGRMVAIENLAFQIQHLESYPSSVVDAVQHNAWWDARALQRRLEELGR